MAAPSSPPPEPEIPTPLPRPIARGEHPYPGPGGSGRDGGPGRYAALGEKRTFTEMRTYASGGGVPGGLLPLDPHTAGLQPHSERRLAQDRRAKAWNIPPSPRGKVREGKSKAFLIVSGEGEGWNFSPRTPP